MFKIPVRFLLVVSLLAPVAIAAAQEAPPGPPPAGQAPSGQPPAGQAPSTQPPLPPVADVPRPAFADRLAGVRKEALALGISERTVEGALAGLDQLPVVVERDRTQAERVMPLDKYLKRRLDRKTLRTAREMARHHAGLLARVSKRYRVPASVIVSVWGLESNFGRFSGVRPTVASLATLAYDNRRAALFRDELFNALRILDRGDIPADQMKGSWAGAMGQPQFMPSSYLQFAQDFDEDGRTDIWHSQADVFASIANFLKQQGWQPGLPWGRRVKVSPVVTAKVEDSAPLRTKGCEAVRQMTEPMPWSRWKAMGVRLEPGERDPAPTAAASLVRAGARGFLVFDNYGALLQYNCAHAYALSVGLLADYIQGKPVNLAEPSKSARSAKARRPAKTTKAARSSKAKARRRAR